MLAKTDQRRLEREMRGWNGGRKGTFFYGASLWTAHFYVAPSPIPWFKIWSLTYHLPMAVSKKKEKQGTEWKQKVKISNIISSGRWLYISLYTFLSWLCYWFIVLFASLIIYSLIVCCQSQFSFDSPQCLFIFCFIFYLWTSLGSVGERQYISF